MVKTKQIGAASVIAIIFLATVVLTVLLLTLKQANTELLDSVSQNETLKALYLAESGLERAAYRYQTIACASLVETAITLGSGTFAITSAVDVSGDCQIQVTGINSNSTRIIQATLSANTGTADAYAVGKQGVIMKRVAGVWTLETSGTTEELRGIECVDSDNCWAVGKNGIVVQKVNGGSWTVSTVDSGDDYNDVACQPSNIDYCLMVGKGDSTDGITYKWNTGTSTWQVSNTATEELKAIACPSTVCYAVGKAGFAQKFASSSWTVETGTGGDTLEDLACIDDNNCWAPSKKSGNNFVLGRRNGSSTWSEFFVNSSSKKDLKTIACSSSTSCWAIGQNGHALRYTGSWSYFGTVDTHEMKGLDCRSSDGKCIAVGRNGSVVHYDGSSWSVETSATTQELKDVAYMEDGSGGAGNISIGDWIEVVNGS